MERVEALLLWQDPYASAKVFGGGLYILICLRHLVCGAHRPPFQHLQGKLRLHISTPPNRSVALHLHGELRVQASPEEACCTLQ